MGTRQVVSEAALGLRRNLVMSVAAILTVAVSLAFVGTALLVMQTVNDIQKIFYTQIEVSIFLDNEVTPPQRQEVDRTLHALPLVRSVVYEDKAEAYRRFRLQFADQPDLLANVTEQALPESFRVQLTDPTKYDVVATAVQNLPGVGQVVDYRKYLDDLFAILTGLRNAAFAAAVLQLVAATLLIANTVRVAAFSRRRETGVMRLVGATRLYIQLPFLLEGIIAGVVGALLGTGLIAAGKALLLDGTLAPLFRSGVIPVVTYGDVLHQSVWLLLLGIAISGLASLLTLQRYIRI